MLADGESLPPPRAPRSRGGGDERGAGARSARPNAFAPDTARRAPPGPTALSRKATDTACAGGKRDATAVQHANNAHATPAAKQLKSQSSRDSIGAPLPPSSTDGGAAAAVADETSVAANATSTDEASEPRRMFYAYMRQEKLVTHARGTRARARASSRSRARHPHPAQRRGKRGFGRGYIAAPGARSSL